MFEKLNRVHVIVNSFKPPFAAVLKQIKQNTNTFIINLELSNNNKIINPIRHFRAFNWELETSLIDIILLIKVEVASLTLGPKISANCNYDCEIIKREKKRGLTHAKF